MNVKLVSEKSFQTFFEGFIPGQTDQSIWSTSGDTFLIRPFRRILKAVLLSVGLGFTSPK